MFLTRELDAVFQYFIPFLDNLRPILSQLENCFLKVLTQTFSKYHIGHGNTEGNILGRENYGANCGQVAFTCSNLGYRKTLLKTLLLEFDEKEEQKATHILYFW